MDKLVTPPDVPSRLVALRHAGAAWGAVPVAERLAVMGRTRRIMAGRAAALAATVGRNGADTLVAEVLPLLEAARFLRRRGAGLLAARRPGGMRPPWLWGVRSEVRRAPLGAVLILAPGNYPLFLPGAQALQALAAGNAVAWKPAPGGAAAADAVAAALAEAGLPAGVLDVLAEGDGPAAVAAGFDHVVLTGSAETGMAVGAACARLLVPCTMELSGCDAVFVLEGADVPLLARALAYGLRLNGGATCIAPRRAFVPRGMMAAVEAALLPLLDAVPTAAVPGAVAARLDVLLAAAAADGAAVCRAGAGRPAVVCGARAEMALLREDVFAPWLGLVAVEDVAEALRFDAACPFALGASVWGPAAAARAVAGQVRAGSVCVNDLIVPTADPRLPFGGAGRSGYGVTRGADGLLRMTRPVVVSERRGRFRPHLAPPSAGDAQRFGQMIRVLHGRWW